MKIQTYYSLKREPAAAVGEIYESISGDEQAGLVIYFASSEFNQSEVARLMADNFKDAVVAGCSTAGEIITGSMLNNSLVAMIFDKSSLSDLAYSVIENIDNIDQIKAAAEKLEEDFNIKLAELDFREYLGLIMIDGLSKCEELLVDLLGNMTNIHIAGASAGDDLKFEKTFVSLNGKVFSNAAVLLILKPENGFEIIKTQSFRSLNKELVATKVDEKNRTVLEFNNKPAVDAYAEVLDISPENVKDYFMSNPIGIVYDDDPYVRSPQKTEGKGIVFFCNIKEGLPLELLESTDIINDTKKSLEHLDSDKVRGIINFNCILRTVELQKLGKTGEYGEIFKNIPTIGFSTYGEELVGHINQTAIMVVFN